MTAWIVRACMIALTIIPFICYAHASWSDHGCTVVNKGYCGNACAYPCPWPKEWHPDEDICAGNQCRQ